MNLYDIVKTKLVCENRIEHRDTKAQSFIFERTEFTESCLKLKEELSLGTND